MTFRYLAQADQFGCVLTGSLNQGNDDALSAVLSNQQKRRVKRNLSTIFFDSSIVRRCHFW
jgi:hypothetical protein